MLGEGLGDLLPWGEVVMAVDGVNRPLLCGERASPILRQTAGQPTSRTASTPFVNL
jgi:hypothetical protein